MPSLLPGLSTVSMGHIQMCSQCYNQISPYTQILWLGEAQIEVSVLLDQGHFWGQEKEKHDTDNLLGDGQMRLGGNYHGHLRKTILLLFVGPC